MPITNKVRNRARWGQFTTQRKEYNQSGQLLSSSTPVTSTTTYTTHPYSGTACYGGNNSHRRDYYVDSDWRSVLSLQGYLPTRTLTHNFHGISGENWANSYRHPTRPLQRIDLVGGYFNPPHNPAGIQDLSTILNPLRAKLEAEAQYRALSKARDMRINLPVTFAEGGKTVRMLTDTVNTLHEAYRAFRKGRFRKAAKALGIDTPAKSLANHWLAYQYGWRPLVSDAVGAATILYDYFNRDRQPRTTVRGSSIDDTKTKGGSLYGAHPQIVGYQQAITWEREAAATAGLLLQVKYTSAALAAQLGVGLTDPLLTAWELTPFSFVFDWFVDVGGWLEARSSLQGFDVLAGWSSSRIGYNFNMKEVPGGGFSKPDFLASWNGRVSEYKRLTWTGSVVQLRAPLMDGLNARRLTSAASLAVQQLKGDRKKGAYRP